jgi:hypothetical protein
MNPGIHNFLHQGLSGGYLGTYLEREGVQREVLGILPKAGSHCQAVPLVLRLATGFFKFKQFDGFFCDVYLKEVRGMDLYVGRQVLSTASSHVDAWIPALSVTESLVFSSMSSGSRISPFTLSVRYLTLPHTRSLQYLPMEDLGLLLLLGDSSLLGRQVAFHVLYC